MDGRSIFDGCGVFIEVSCWLGGVYGHTEVRVYEELRGNSFSSKKNIYLFEYNFEITFKNTYNL